MKKKNPFIISGYHSPEYFCNRELETKKIISALENNRNITLLSARKIGKTGLIKHVFHKISEINDQELLYIDIMPTLNLHDFVKEFSSAIIENEKAKSKKYLEKLTSFLAGIKAKIVFNSFTGMPEIEFDYQHENESERNIGWIFNYLAQSKKQYFIAIDEFQQITNYPEKNVEAILRKYIQEFQNGTFLFSGSNKHLLTSIFSNHARPFYQSSDFLSLEKLNPEIYCQFISQKFQEAGKEISLEIIYEILDYYEVHTFYVQYFFNKLFALNLKQITPKTIVELKSIILDERESIYYNYRNLLSSFQFKLLEAIAKENGISKPTSKEFIRNYNLNQASSVSSAIKALLDKEMIFYDEGKYKIYDIFFSKWLSGL